jgi:ABC-2 type transport system ATP-binding protein
MKQRLGIALALLHDPELLILDEPTNGLDPGGIIEMRQLLKRLNQEFSKTILISSHLLNEVEKIISDVAIIHLGKILFEGSFYDLQQKKSKQIVLELEVNDSQRTIELLENRFSVAQKNGKILIDCSSKEDIAIVNANLVNSGIKVYRLAVENNSLENIFIQTISN